eukprot:CAMPEP_0113468518 /NCGR_PEP_ID=MMETSP0014_2-20120614/15399_1 /TAXON_ID=2857 /ORGANISM="Nitzschia sp." /LENGTH=210 /DNA_ID=CAMNT_0000360915 /DNA_START=196 /DNA_END=828 /DNA_ORIENTATION=+ /assembly_acc=CAM_ASM_000159
MMMNKRFQIVFFTTAAVVAAFGSSETSAFVAPNTSSRTSPSLALAAQNDDDDASCSRRDALFGVAAAAFLGVTTGVVSTPQAAEAKYSDYSRREKDWEERQKTGDVKISTARDLRKQLAEIVPANSEGSKVFCPNGPSAAVSPLMENKCSDVLMAMPSVYGRQADVVGNSIPGFSGGYATGVGAGTTSISASIGGMPAYKENEWKLRNQQ